MIVWLKTTPGHTYLDLVMEQDDYNRRRNAVLQVVIILA